MRIVYGILAASHIVGVFGETYSLTSSIVGADFLNEFRFEAIPDPTHGRVNYVDEATARALHLVHASDKSFIIRADNTTVLSASGPGRNSVRIRSNAQFTTHVAIFDIRHVPEGCGTWPAVWETGESHWPSQGEIDIYEGVNDQGPNLSTLHTSPGCTMPKSRNETGTPVRNDCNAFVDNNSGCGVQFNDATSFGPVFNGNGGGRYAVERSTSFIKVWFWPRHNSNVPSDILDGSKIINTHNWGIPSADFPSVHCDLETHFGPNNIIVDLTFCGDWAGAVYGTSGCPSTCVDFVNNNPSAFTNAYFDFASLNIYVDH